MYKLFLFSLALFASLISYSQSSKTPAIIIFSNSDTLSAEIRDEQLNLIQQRIYYRQPGAAAFIKALPEQIKSVRFADGRLFETVQTDSVSSLLFCLIEGYYNLFTKAENKGLNTYFIRHAEEMPIHLVETFTDKYLQEDGKIHRFSNFEYVHSLTTAMADNAKITTELSEMKFKEDELVAIVKEYNEFKGNNYPEDSNLKKKMKLSTGILINYYPYTDLFELQAAGVGMSVDFYRNRPYQRFGLKTHFTFNLVEYTKNESYTFNIEVPLAVSYNCIERSRLRLYFLGGITSFVFFDSEISDGKRNNSIWGSPSLYLGSGIDYKIKKSALRFEISLLPLRYMLAYIF